ncbi:Tether containing UBX domain for GLUT4 [Escovopsis weberi]|uniref:Tether containing UBX domain for GLUT4 n=1 Tax=Escovopsis weberi TaxID=150374 RepID=A0A0M8MY88_ESCWE|nr:Tether containing UBX domain for GLUT4 [Escovopsis weberi]
MSTHVVVISTDLRRATVKVSPGTYLSDVLEQACKKLNVDESKHILRHKQKTVDLSVPFRTSGLVAGAKLELVLRANTPSAVQIALQVPQPEAREIPGGRLIKKFPADLPIWQVLRQFESGEASAGKNINITARGVAQTANGAGSGGGQLFYETPVLNIMGREMSTFAQFQKSMSQLGHNSGNVLIRLSFRRTDQTLYDAMAEMGRFFKEEEQQQQQAEGVVTGQGEKEEETAPAQQHQPTVDGVVTGDLALTDTPPTSGEPPSVQGHQGATPEAPGNAHDTPRSDSSPAPQNQYEPVGVFLAPSGSTPAAALAPVEENDFTPTIAHAQLHQQRLQDSSRNKRLPSDRELQEKEDLERARIAAVKSVLVKVRFPDNTSSDWQVGPADTGAFLHAAVRHVMASPEQPFHLAVSGGARTAIKDDADPRRHGLVGAYRFAGRVLVNLVWDDGVPPEVRRRPFLRGGVASQAQAVKVQDIPVSAAEDEEPDGGAGGPAAAAASGRPTRRDEGDGAAKKVPKWFKFGKK